MYFAGDTDLFSGMKALRGEIDLALLPVGSWGPTLGQGIWTQGAPRRLSRFSSQGSRCPSTGERFIASACAVSTVPSRASNLASLSERRPRSRRLKFAFCSQARRRRSSPSACERTATPSRTWPTGRGASSARSPASEPAPSHLIPRPQTGGRRGPRSRSVPPRSRNGSR